MKLLAIVIVYYPDETVANHIRSYLPVLDRLIVWDNTPAGDRTSFGFGPEEETKIVRMGTGKNVGIGTALNTAVAYGRENGFTHLLTMDQDSSFAPGDAVRYKAAAEAYGDDGVACFGAGYRQDAPPPVTGAADAGWQEVIENITSGSIFPLAVFERTGLFREDFFIDAIDNEFCFRARHQGYKIPQATAIRMRHKLGYAETVPFLWGKCFLLNYSPARTYYIVRNHLLVRRMYPDYQPLYFVRDHIVYRAAGILLKETEKWKKIRAIGLGLFHAWRKRTGEYPG